MNLPDPIELDDLETYARDLLDAVADDTSVADRQVRATVLAALATIELAREVSCLREELPELLAEGGRQVRSANPAMRGRAVTGPTVPPPAEPEPEAPAEPDAPVAPDDDEDDQEEEGTEQE